jgi:hypothetical protein
MPPWSVRIDPFNWLLEGRLGLELELGIVKWMSLELVPVFIVNEKPPTFNFVGREDPLTQESNGLGALAGTSISAGFWLEGKALQGNVLRVIFTDYGLTYKSHDDAGVFDQVSHTERHLYGYFGSHHRWGAFTLVFGIGLGAELNKQERCFPDGATTPAAAIESNCDGELQIALDRNVNTVANLNSWLHPVQLLTRISLGIAID